MVAFQLLSNAPVWAKAGGMLLLANEVRGVLVATGIAADYHANGVQLGQLWFAPLVLVPILALWAWKTATARRRISRRLAY